MWFCLGEGVKDWREEKEESLVTESELHCFEDNYGWCIKSGLVAKAMWGKKQFEGHFGNPGERWW